MAMSDHSRRILSEIRTQHGEEACDVAERLVEFSEQLGAADPGVSSVMFKTSFRGKRITIYMVDTYGRFWIFFPKLLQYVPAGVVNAFADEVRSIRSLRDMKPDRHCYTRLPLVRVFADRQEEDGFLTAVRRLDLACRRCA